MNKQIIDGVDVSGREYLQQEDVDHDYTCYAEEGYQSGEICCSACPNCYYKQLKCKEEKLVKAKLMLQIIIEQNNIYPLQVNLLKLSDIIGEKENA